MISNQALHKYIVLGEMYINIYLFQVFLLTKIVLRANPFFFEILLKNIFSFLIFLLKPKSIGENYDHNFHY